ncbi:MAG: hypothetical protein A3F72_12290 [Bacteroidetes bacterium RIFCSPLOWO2_12_FULL_35_15]|nr:MAG: hypothetical protein A3F72_12290 [Bacteroidetes bacterium RIFCSPLOWO2_12_FULL_35_15]
MNFFVIEGLSKNKITGLFVLKLIAGFSFLAIYKFYYSSGDFDTYFSDSKILVRSILGNEQEHFSEAWNGNFGDVLYGNARFIIIINAILQLFSFGNFFVHLIFFNFFSFIGLTALFKAFVKHFPHKKSALLLGIYFIPSVLFWSSGVLKEGLLMGSLGLFIYFSDFGLLKNYSLKNGFLAIFFFIAVCFIKTYIGFLLIPLIISNIIVSRTSAKLTGLKYGIVFLIIIFLAGIIALVKPDYNPLVLISDKQAKAISESKGGVFLESDKKFIWVDYNLRDSILIPQKDFTYKIKTGSSFLSWELDNMRDTTFVEHSTDTSNYKLDYSVVPANTIIELKRLKPNATDFLSNSPKSFYNVLIQPTVFQVKNWLQLIASIENLSLLFFIFLALFFYDRSIFKNKEILLFCFLFTLLLFVLIGITTPSVGGMVRYKMPALPFLYASLFLLIDMEKLKKALAFLTKKK